MYFAIVRDLSSKGYNPKIELTSEYVTKGDLVEVFGPKCNFKLTNPLIHAETKHELKKIHYKIYGVPQLTNMNSCYGWSKDSIGEGS